MAFPKQYFNVNMMRIPHKPRPQSPLAWLTFLKFSLLALPALLVGCSGTDLLNRLTPSSTYVKTANLAYGPNPRMKLDVYQPASQPQHAPVVVFFYGGSWNSGDRADYTFVGEALAARGIIAVIADYRLYPEVRYPDFLKDCAAAVAWTFREVAHYGGDTQRIFVAGHSAGAYNAAMLAYDERLLAPFQLKPQQLRGFIGLAGPYNFLPIETEEVKPVFDFPNTSPDTQPINHVQASAPKTLLIAAVKDSFVNPQRNTQMLAAKLRAMGVSVTVQMHERVNHLTLIGAMARPLRILAPVDQEVTDFVLNN